MLDTPEVDHVQREGARFMSGEQSISLIAFTSPAGRPECALIFHRTNTDPRFGVNWTDEPISMKDRLPALGCLTALRRDLGIPEEIAKALLFDILDILPEKSN
ncbi:hypothetical protein KBD34_02850 [Patescibacteria group bacterium]|nr:hypothetical protein [Patescibacteria group bacterium]